VQRGDHLVFAHHAVRNQPIDFMLGTPQDMAMRRQDGVEALALEALERGEIVAHVAIGRCDHRGGPVQDVIARQQQLVFLEQQQQR